MSFSDDYFAQKKKKRVHPFVIERYTGNGQVDIAPVRKALTGDDIAPAVKQTGSVASTILSGGVPSRYSSNNPLNPGFSSTPDEDLQKKFSQYASNPDWTKYGVSNYTTKDVAGDFQTAYSLAVGGIPQSWAEAKRKGISRTEYEEAEKQRRYIGEKYGIDTTDADALDDLTNNLNEISQYVDQMTDAEKAVLSYMFRTEGAQSAVNWFNTRRYGHEKELAGKTAEEMAEYGKKKPLRASLKSVGLNLLAPIEYAADSLRFSGTDEKYINSMADQANALRAGVMDRYDWNIAGWDAFDFLYSTAMSMADSGVSMLTGPFAELSQGLSAAAHATNDAFKRGMDKKSAARTGLIAGATEALFEHLSIGNFRALKEVDAATIKDIVKNIGKSMLTNASEETLTEISNLVYDDIANGDYSQWEINYQQRIANGETPQEARRHAWGDAIGQVVEAGASGALMGFGFGAIGSAGTTVQGSKKNALTANEKKVVDKVYNDRIAEAEKNGEKVNKSKVWDSVIEEMEKGDISTDTIEEVLGGETYKTYRDTVDSEDALQKEFDELSKVKAGEATLEQQARHIELRQKLADLSKGSNRSQLKQQLGTEVSELVKGDRLAESYNEKARRGQAFEADLTQYDEKQRTIVQKAIDSGILNNTRRSHELVDLVSRVCANKGLDFDFANNQKLKESGFALEGKTVNGYLSAGGITLNVDSPKVLNAVVGHEIAHVFEDTELYQPMQEALFAYAKSKGEYDSRLKAVTELYQGIEGADPVKELTADLIGDYLFTDSDFVNRLSTENRNVFQKIYDEIKYLCKVATAGSKEARQLEKVKKIFAEAYRTTEAKTNTAQDGGVRYSLVGRTADGLGIYKTNYPPNTPKTVKQAELISLVQNVWSENPITLTIVEDGKYVDITAKFNPDLSERSDLAKIAFGNRKGTGPEKRMTLDLASDLYQIASESKFAYSKEAIPKPDNPAHDGVTKYHYFLTNLVYKGNDGDYIDCHMNIDVKRNQEGDWFYSFAIEKGSAPQTLLAAVTGNPATLPNNNIFEKEETVKQNLSISGQHEIAPPRGNFRITGKDISLEGVPIRSDIAPVKPNPALEGVPIRKDIAKPKPSLEGVPIRKDIAPVGKAIAPSPEGVPIRKDITQVAETNQASSADKIVSTGAVNGKQRKWVGTSTESEAVGHKVLPEDLDQDLIHYQPISNKRTLGNANSILDRMGYEKSIAYLEGQFANSKVTLDDIALGERLIQEAVKRGDTKTAGDLIMDISILGTELGQKVQALSIIKRLTPEGQLRMLQRTVERGKAKGDKAFEGVEITQDMMDHILKTYGKDGTYDQSELNKAVEDVKQQIADQMKVTSMDKVNAWRYLSMLGNPKTHIRNIVSNVAMRGTVAVKNAVARTIEDIAPVKNRTKTWKAASKAVKDFARQTTIEMKDIISGDSKYSESASIKEKRAIFKSKILNGLYEFNSDMLSKEDWWFSKPAFTNALTEYMTANGIATEADIKNKPNIVEKAKQYALEQSQIATFRQYSWLANKINEIERKNAATNIAVGAVLPFKKTPVNIAKTGLSYSPLGFAKTLTYDIAQVKKGNMEASELVDHLAQNVTGTVLTLVGYMLASAGFLNGAGDDDKEGSYDYQLGKQAYSVNIGGATFSLSWLSPVAMPLFVGANAYEQLVEGKEWNGDVVVQTLAQTLDPLSEMSFISSLDNVLSSYDSGIEKFAGIGETMAQNYITQFVPTLSSQVASAFDDTKRTTKVAADSNFKFFDETINNLMYKIPGLRNLLEPSTDIWGNEIKQNENVLTRAFESFLAPYARREDIATAVDKEIKDLYRQTGDNGVIPSVPYNYLNYDGVKYEMSAKEFTEYKKVYGQTAFDLMEDLFDTKTYQSADSETRAELVNDVYDYARDAAKRDYFAQKGVTFTNATRDGKEYYKVNPIKGAIKNDLPVDEYVFSTENPERYAVAKAAGGYEAYKSYTIAIEDIESDKNENGNPIKDSRKKKVVAYINNLDADYGEKIILFKSEYPSDDTYNYEIIDYLNGRQDISYKEMETILKELGFKVDSEGRITWD